MGGISYKYENAKLLGNDLPGVNVIVPVKSWKKSKTVVINGSILIVSMLVQLLDIITGANILESIVGVFAENPETIARVVLVVSQVYTALNLYLRYVTNSPITFKNNN